MRIKLKRSNGCLRSPTRKGETTTEEKDGIEAIVRTGTVGTAATIVKIIEETGITVMERIGIGPERKGRGRIDFNWV